MHRKKQKKEKTGTKKQQETEKARTERQKEIKKAGRNKKATETYRAESEVENMWEELGISGGTALIILAALYFVIKRAVRKGIMEAQQRLSDWDTPHWKDKVNGFMQSMLSDER